MSFEMSGMYIYIEPPERSTVRMPVQSVYDEYGYRVKNYRKIATVKAVEMEYDFHVDTPEGTMRGRKGDFLVFQGEGEGFHCWPVKKEVFTETHVMIGPDE